MEITKPVISFFKKMSNRSQTLGQIFRGFHGYERERVDNATDSIKDGINYRM